MISQITEKAKAAAIHLIISAIVIALFFAIIFFVWFPNGLIYAGALDGLQLVVLVDLVLGPLLTFVVFNRSKKSLKFDLSVIALIQLAALVYGGKTIYEERPVLAVLGTFGLDLATSSQLKEWNIEQDNAFYHGPINMYLDVGNDLATIMPAEAVHVFTSDTPYTMQADLFKPLASIDRDVFLKRVEIITARLVNDTTFVDLSESGKESNELCKWLPLNSKHIDDQGFACVTQEQGVKKIKIIPYDSL